MCSVHTIEFDLCAYVRSSTGKPREGGRGRRDERVGFEKHGTRSRQLMCVHCSCVDGGVEYVAARALEIEILHMFCIHSNVPLFL